MSTGIYIRTKEMYNSRRGRKHSDETKALMSSQRKGERHWNWNKKFSNESKLKMSLSHKGVSTWNKGLTKTTDLRMKLFSERAVGRKSSEETKKKLSKYHTGKHIGEKNHFWKGGISADPNYQRNHNNKNREKYLADGHMHRMRRRNVGGFHSIKEWNELKAKYSFMCLCCKKSEPEIKLSADHIIPVIKWKLYIQFHSEIKYGCNDIENIQPLCGSCNSKKNTKIINFINNNV